MDKPQLSLLLVIVFRRALSFVVTLHWTVLPTDLFPTVGNAI